MSTDGDQIPLVASTKAATFDGRFNENLYFSAEFNKQITTQRVNLWIAGGFTLVVLLASLFVTWYLFRTGSSSGVLFEYMKLGPVAISSLALPFPLRMYLSYRVRIPIYRGYRHLFDEAAARGTSVEPSLVEDARAALKALYKID
jgi:hypothetical protein